MKRLRTLLYASCLLLALPLQAAVLIESINNGSERTQIYTDGDLARIDTGSYNGFLLVNVKNKTMYLVVKEHRGVVDLSDVFQQPANPSHNSEGEFIDAYVEPLGLGRKIAGYETEKFELRVNDKTCGTAMVSDRALRDTGFKKFFPVFSRLPEYMNQKLTGGIIPMPATPCARAELKLMSRLLETGFPLQFTDFGGNGTVIKRIDRKAQLPERAFEIPADYKPMTAAELVSNALKPIGNIPPEMIEMMKNLPPEARQLMMKQMELFSK